MTMTRRTSLKVLGASAAVAGLAPLGRPLSALAGRGLFDPVAIGPLRLKNRLIRAATSMEMADHSGGPTPELLDVYTAAAKGGAGMVVTGLTYVDKEDQNFPAALGFYDDAQIPTFRELARTIQDNGALSCLQIGYAGSLGGYRIGERDILGPSAVQHPFTKVTPRAMTLHDIKAAVAAMAAAARRAKASGFDAVELHFVHNFMLHQFLAPYFNRRTDNYGGPIENRARIVFEIMEAVRAAVGPDYPVIAKIHGHDYLDKDGMTLDEGLYVARGLAARSVTALEVSGGNLMSAPENLPIRPGIIDDPALQSYFAEDAAAIEEELDVPLILTGGNRNTRVMQNVLDTNPDVAAFGLCRTILSEPGLPNTWKADPAAVPQCISCNWCIEHYGAQPTACVLNT